MKAPMTPPALAVDAHKGDAGRVLIIAGSAMMPGAAILAGRGALRAGAGLVTIACQDRALTRVLPAAIPEVTYLDLDGSSFAGLLTDRSDHAIACGPGLGVAPGHLPDDQAGFLLPGELNVVLQGLEHALHVFIGHLVQ